MTFTWLIIWNLFFIKVTILIKDFTEIKTVLTITKIKNNPFNAKLQEINWMGYLPMQ